MKKLSKTKIEKTCKIGKGADCCRYLVAGPSGIECAKLTEAKGIIDARVQAGYFTAKGDNCKGFDHGK